MYDSSAIGECIAAYSSYSVADKSVAMYGSKINSSTGENVAIWSSTIDSNETKPVLTLWNNKIKMQDGFINGIKFYYFAGGENYGQFPDYGFTIEQDVIYVL